MVLKAIEELGVQTFGCVYVGDSNTDILTAQNTGIPCISVSWGFRAKEFLLENGAKTIIDAPAELLKFLN